MNISRKIAPLLLQLFVIQLLSQPTIPYHPPLKIPMYLSGNFGEIRSDHFHSGIDIKTQGTTGHHVFAIQSAYVSRIKVQANGYGNSIYLSHPDGHTSVYGHLNRYREDIAAYVKEVQYRRQSHQVDIYLEKEEFTVEKGEFIAYSGNTGGSMGPHLHFEIRNSANQHPINALQFGFNIKDEIAPKFLGLFIYPLGPDSRVNGSNEKQSFKLVYDQGHYTIPWGSTMEISGKTGIGVEVYDYLDGSYNRCGIYSLEAFLDDKLFYSHEMEEFSFSETRYINAHVDYHEKVTTGKKPHRLYRLPNDKLRIYRHMENEGILNIEDPGIYTIRVVAADVSGNQSELSFEFVGKSVIPETLSPPEEELTYMNFDKASLYKNGGVRVEIPAYALYEDLGFSYRETPSSHEFLSVNYQIHDQEVPLHKPFTLSVEAPEVATELLGKLVFVSYNRDEKKHISAGGKYSNGRLSTSLRNFGEYTVSLDTIAPEIIPIKGSANTDQTGRSSIRFTIRDDLSGIEKYEGYIDNHWALFEYDPKNELLIYTFDEERISRNQEHELELYISDSQGNVNLYHTTFAW